MTKEIWKYSLEVSDEQLINMRRGAVILCVQVQFGVPCIWVLVDPSEPSEQWRFRLYGTGHPMDETGQYIGTFQLHDGNLVFHLFKVPS